MLPPDFSERVKLWGVPNSMISSPRIPIDALRTQFELLLRASETSLDAPEFAATWRAFCAFAQVEAECDDESLFFECGLSPSDESRFYVNFTRTFFGRDAGNHFWSNELNCDFLFESDEALEVLGATIEADDLAQKPAERAEFFRAVEAQQKVWRVLGDRQSLEATIYIGES